MITSEKLVGSENYLSWSASVELWFMVKVIRITLLRKRLTSSSWFLRLLASVQILRPFAIRFLADPQFHPWMMLVTDVEVNVLIAPIAISLATLVIGGISLIDSEYDDYLRYQATKSAFVASVAQTGNASACLTHTSSLGPWILDSGASDHISSNKDLFSSITTTSALPTVTLANGSQTMAKDRSTGKTIGIGRESQGLYHLTSPSTPAVCISTDAPLLIHSRLGHPSLSKTNFLPKPQNASSWDIPDFKRVIVVIPLRLIATFSPLMSLSLRTHHSSPPLSLFLFLKSYPSHYLPPDAVPSPTSGLSSSSSCRCSSFFGRGWRQAMVDEMTALHSNDTWDLVVLPSGKSTVGCRWVYTVKVGPDDSFVCLLLSMAAMHSWPLYQLDIKNAFLHGDLAKEVYMEQPPIFVAQGESGLVCSIADHSVFYHHNSSGQCIYLVVYVDDIVITGSDQNGIQKLKQHLFTHFQTKDLGKLKYFLGIEIVQSSSGVVLSQRKYALDILEETGMLDCKPVDTPMDQMSNLYQDRGAFRRSWEISRLVGKLNYLTITRPDISFPHTGQGVLYKNRGHTQVVGYTDANWAGSPQIDVPLLAEYRAMALATCELIWLKHLLRELRFGKDEQMKLICDNQAALHIASNPVFHERTKHIEVFTIPVAPGDVIVAGTDGLFDNLYNSEVTAVVVHAVRAGLGPQVTAQKIAALARQRAQDRMRQTPFSTAAQDAGFRYYGGKLDDITLVEFHKLDWAMRPRKGTCFEDDA
ncbi:Retrovirus-related Pol polyprotein from transposon RE1 [Vitis vinifera]|uniref:Protein phosphatase n=1 Tax=Vitis vinifera TaxID=29760 RepID=A0A438GP38_VITVI|nr:Retrovirus-related Pol polyprotein from transposon RE1 [Vitis vinifera]